MGRPLAVQSEVPWRERRVVIPIVDSEFHRSEQPYDQFVRELLTASGSTYKNPAANYYRVSREYQPAVENTTQLFLGVRFQCNVCHDHPFEKWTQNQFYELAAYFGKVGVKPGQLPDEEIVYTKYSGGEVTHPKTADVVMASVPYGKPMKLDRG